MLNDADIGGAYVRRIFSSGEESLRPGTVLSGDDVRAIPIANRRALVDAGYMELFPQAPEMANTERHMLHIGGGRYEVVVGHKLTKEPVTRDEAEALVSAARN